MRFVAVTRDTSRFQEPLSDALIATLCRRAFGAEAKPRSARWIHSGKFNTTYRIELASRSAVILRVAPPAHAPIFAHEVLLLRREAGVQRVLEQASDRIPRNLFVDFTREHCDRDYVFQSCLPGRLWDDIKAGISVAQHERLWAELASIVKAIHAIRGSRFGFPLPCTQFDHWSDAFLGLVSGMIDDMRRIGLTCDDALAFLRRVEANRRYFDGIAEPRLVHGDLWPKNILIDFADGMPFISGVLDAERAFWGDPGAEWIFSFLDLPASFWRAYGKPASDDAAAFRTLAYTGSGAIKLCLEAWRFAFDDTPFRRILADVNREFDA